MPRQGNLSFTGDDAEKFLGAEIGDNIVFKVSAKLQSVIHDEFGFSASFDLEKIEDMSEEGNEGNAPSIRNFEQELRDSII